MQASGTGNMATTIAQYLADPIDLGEKNARTLNVLVLDDLESDRVRIRRLLRKAGLDFEFYEAADLESFLSQIDDVQMDLVFLDYHLEIDNGLNALKRLNAHAMQEEALPIMVTSVDRCDIAVEAMRNGCADYLIKEQLTVESMRKSVVSAYERRILISTLSRAQSDQHAVWAMISRFARTSAPGFRSVLAATLRHARSARSGIEKGSHFEASISGLERSCLDAFAFFDGLIDLLEKIEAPNQERRPVPNA